ncbi:acyl-CoA 6-desaturase-like [Mya arenaria]|uniref:acyl-CoA 6-desaturase-like n=1 Tax=Mya arenaria TaxID=6604 RepID=UPI0022E6556C|nr:acyl-CoA 6-desaturase-like [Mya arenaria]
MGKGGRKLENGDSKVIPWSEIETHNNRNDSWVVILGRVYNVTNFMKKHPGGARLLGSYAGQDATDVWTGMHNDKDFVGKFMKPLYIGDAEQRDTIELENDFRELRKHVEDSDLLRVNPMFYILHLVSILAFEVAGYLILSRLGISWFPYITAATCFLISQAQAGWLQHDFGHLSVFNSRRLNHIAHHLIIGHLKGASSHWWNFRHFLHHAKPNIIKIDPDVKTANLFLLGEVMPKLFGTKKRGMMPYQYQHVYFFLLSPLLLPTYFVFENLFFVVKRRDYVDLFFTASFFFKLFSLLGPILGGWGTFWFFMFVRFFESYWFVWCTQMSHIPNEVDFDHAKDWFRLQLDSTCNVNPSWFNDWFSGHLNYQIEHHLFPTMPRHNFGKIAPLVISLAKKHGVKYSCKSLPTAFADILRSLEHSGEIWYNAYYEGLDS